MSTRAILYSDFNCPFCYAMNERLKAAGLDAPVEWRGVQHAPELPIPMTVAGALLASEQRREVHAIQRLAPEIPIALPGGKPNTEAAILTVTAAWLRDPAAASRLKDELYRAFWAGAADLSDPELLDGLGRRHRVGILDRERARPLVARWQSEWTRTGVEAVPALVRADGKVLRGLLPTEHIALFLRDGAPVRAR